MKTETVASLIEGAMEQERRRGNVRAILAACLGFALGVAGTVWVFAL